MQPCPVPDIDRALLPYIKSREEALKIRRTLTRYLTSSLRPVNSATQNQHLNHEVPRGLGAVGTNPPGLKGSRGAYLDAVRSHKAAQSRLERLQTSLQELQERHVVETPTRDDSQENENVQSYITLLRQRRRFAELEIVQKSLEKLLNINPIEGSKDPRDHVKDAIGEQPSLPAERLEALSNDEVSDSSMLKLKKEVLDARSSMEQAKAARSEAHNAPRDIPNLEVQVYALARARDEMVAWVQDELAKMEEESGFLEDASPVKRSTANSDGQDLASAESRIQDCYATYTSSRSAAVQTHQSFQQSPTSQSTQAGDMENATVVATQDIEKPKPKIRVSSLLPYLPHLARIHENERLMLLQAVYMKTQLSSADDEINETLARLAGESHILPSGARGVESWGSTAVELESGNAKAVEEHLQKSRSEINSVTAIVNLCSLQSEVLDAN